MRSIFLPALANHPHELRTLLSGCAGDALIREQASHCPLWICHDFIYVIRPLCLVAGELFFGVRADPAVGRDTELPPDGAGSGELWIDRKSVV